MAPKNERFEMRLDEDILIRVDTWRSNQDDVPSRAEAMRRLVEIGLAKTSGDSVRLSEGEKLIAIMLRDIYKHIKLDRGEIDPDFVSAAIYGGHNWGLNWQHDFLFTKYEDNPKDVRFVVDVLDMWSFIENGYERLPKKDKQTVMDENKLFANTTFIGFDGNDEAELSSIVNFLIDKLGRFTNFKGRDLNSHMPTGNDYAKMLRRFEPIRKTLVGKPLSSSQIVQILKSE